MTHRAPSRRTTSPFSSSGSIAHKVGSKQCGFEPCLIGVSDRSPVPALAISASANPFKANVCLAPGDVDERIAVKGTAPDTPICFDGAVDVLAHRPLSRQKNW